MTPTFEVPGTKSMELDCLLLDVNGTLTDRGELLSGVRERLARLRDRFEVYLLSADTYGTMDGLARDLGVEARRVAVGAEKLELVRLLGPGRCAAIGNGRNDAQMLAEVCLGIAVVGPEGASRSALNAADLICPSIEAALGLLAEPQALAATLRP